MTHHQGNAFRPRRRSWGIDRVWLRHPLLLLTVGSLLGGGVLGCGGDTTGPATAPLSSVQAYWALRLNYQALNMATVVPADTVRLIPTPVNADGTPLTDLGQATFTASDSSVTVDATGLVTAHYPTQGSPTAVTATLTAQGVTLRATALIQVTDAIPQHALATFSLQPAPGDSAKRAEDFGSQGGAGQFPWLVTATDVADSTVCDSTHCPLLVFYSSSNPLVATIDSLTGQVTALHPGHVTFRASTWAYGVVRRDSVAFTVGYRLNDTVEMTLAVILGVLTLGFAAPKHLVLGVGAVVTFCNGSTKPVDVVFDHPAAVDSASCELSGTIVGPPTGGGNIPAFGGVVQVNAQGDTSAASDPANLACRRFSVPGIYRYHSTLFPSDTFVIEIKPEH